MGCRLMVATLIDLIHQINQSTNPAELGSGGKNSKLDNFFNRYNKTYSRKSRGPGSCHKERHEERPPGILS